MKKEVTFDAIRLRLMRCLSAKGKKMHSGGNGRWMVAKGSEIVEVHSDLETMARSYGKLADYEVIIK